MMSILDVCPAYCGHCDAEIEEASVEAFELTGELLCEDCADDALALGDDWSDDAPSFAATAP